jgi:carbamoyltransferase
VVASIQHIWKDTVRLIFNRFIPKNSTVIYSGGCAQNTLTNKELLKDYPNLDIVPHCYDGGLSLGCLAFVILKHNLQFPKLENFPYIQTDISVDLPSDNTIKKVAKLLAEGKIVGWYQGHGEIGPRALGNRSILMNPSIKNAKDILNYKVKHREHWRPFAPVVMEEHAGDWFDMKKSKYMLFAANVHKNKRKFIPAVIHKDGTSRIQTVTLEDNKILYNLLKEFYSITNIPMLLNTSLNKGGGPIVGDPSQAMDIFKDTEMDALCVGNKLYKKSKINKIY